jgi:uncharacterized membrane protein
MLYRRSIALLAMVNALVALYLHLWKIGKAGTLSCGAEGGCAYVQLSSYGWFMGVDVALIGVIGYSLILVVAIAGALVQTADAPWPTSLLMGLIWPAVLFTARLKYGEFIVLKSFCPWCAISAVSITLCAILVTLDYRRVRALAAAPSA